MPAGVAWFEVDRSDVLGAKQKALKRAGAAFSEQENKRGQPSSHPSKFICLVRSSTPAVMLQTEHVRPGRQVNFSQIGNHRRQPKTSGVLSGAKYPLKAASYITCSVDLENQNWVDGLIERGFDPEVPTCWLLEGLVMYLSPVAVEKLLKGMHAVSATGSRLLIMVCVPPIAPAFSRQIYLQSLLLPVASR